MATYKVTYKTPMPVVEIVDDVTNENVAVMMANSLHPEIPMSVGVDVELVCE